MAEKTKSEIAEKFENQGYPIHVIGRHVEITDAMKSYAVEKLMKVERFGEHILEATIIMDTQKAMHVVDLILNMNNTMVKVSGRTENIYASVDEAIAHLERKLRRYMHRIREHKNKPLYQIDMNVNVIQGPVPFLDEINDQIEEENLKKVEEKLRPHPVISREKQPLKTLNQHDAVMKMELADFHFMVYRSEEDKKLKVIYRREDGNYGIIEPE